MHHTVNNPATPPSLFVFRVCLMPSFSVAKIYGQTSGFLIIMWIVCAKLSFSQQMKLVSEERV